MAKTDWSWKRRSQAALSLSLACCRRCRRQRRKLPFPSPMVGADLACQHRRPNRRNLEGFRTSSQWLASCLGPLSTEGVPRRQRQGPQTLLGMRCESTGEHDPNNRTAFRRKCNKTRQSWKRRGDSEYDSTVVRTSADGASKNQENPRTAKPPGRKAIQGGRRPRGHGLLLQGQLADGHPGEAACASYVWRCGACGRAKIDCRRSSRPMSKEG